MSGDIQVPIPVNEPVLPYTAGTPEKEELKAKLRAMASEEMWKPGIASRPGGLESRPGLRPGPGGLKVVSSALRVMPFMEEGSNSGSRCLSPTASNRIPST